MDVQKLIDAINEIAAEIVAKTETTKDDIALQIWTAVWERWGRDLFGSTEDPEKGFAQSIANELYGS